MWTSIIAYIAGYIILGMVISFIPETSEKRSAVNYTLVLLFWPFVITWILLLILYMGVGWLITKLIKKIKDFKH